MMLLSFVVSLLLPSLASPAQILFASGICGSHLFASVHLTRVLARNGHNVTLLSACRDGRVAIPSNITHVYPVDPSEGGYTSHTEFSTSSDGIFHAAASVPTKTMPLSTFLTNEYQIMVQQIDDFFMGEKVTRLLEEESYDLIVVEEIARVGIAVQTRNKTIPQILLSCVADLRLMVRGRAYLPTLWFSEPGFDNSNPLEGPQSFMDRFTLLLSLIRKHTAAASLAVGQLQRFIPDASLETHLKLAEIPTITLINDHPALSFPYLTPPSVVYIAQLMFNENTGIHGSLPDHLDAFINHCKYGKTVYFSFGSYLGQLSFADELLDHLRSLEVCMVMKVIRGMNRDNLPSDQFLLMDWVPQNNLLASGRVELFISHCGNNGRLEASLHRVPLLCIPLFEDQLMNARLVTWKGFGVMLAKEDLNQESLSTAVATLIAERREIVARIDRAVHRVMRDPDHSAERVLLLVDQLVRYGEVNFTRNHIPYTQTTVEAFNLDILGLVTVGVVLLGYGAARVVMLVVGLVMRVVRERW